MAPKKCEEIRRQEIEESRSEKSPEFVGRPPRGLDSSKLSSPPASRQIAAG